MNEFVSRLKGVEDRRIVPDRIIQRKHKDAHGEYDTNNIIYACKDVQGLFASSGVDYTLPAMRSNTGKRQVMGLIVTRCDAAACSLLDR